MKETEGRKEDQKEQRKIEMIKEEHVKSFMYIRIVLRSQINQLRVLMWETHSMHYFIS